MFFAEPGPTLWTATAKGASKTESKGLWQDQIARSPPHPSSWPAAGDTGVTRPSPEPSQRAAFFMPPPRASGVVPCSGFRVPSCLTLGVWDVLGVRDSGFGTQKAKGERRKAKNPPTSRWAGVPSFTMLGLLRWDIRPFESHHCERGQPRGALRENPRDEITESERTRGDCGADFQPANPGGQNASWKLAPQWSVNLGTSWNPLC